MLNDLTAFVNTHSSAADRWPMFFGQLRRFTNDFLLEYRRSVRKKAKR